jgi:hypothetical protein
MYRNLKFFVVAFRRGTNNFLSFLLYNAKQYGGHDKVLIYLPL